MNSTKVIFSSTNATTASDRTVRVDNSEASGCDLVIQVNSASTASVKATIQGLRPGSTTSPYDIISSSLSTTGTHVLRVYPGLTSATSLVANNALPMNAAVKLEFGANPISVDIGMNLLK